MNLAKVKDLQNVSIILFKKNILIDHNNCKDNLGALLMIKHWYITTSNYQRYQN